MPVVGPAPLEPASPAGEISLPARGVPDSLETVLESQSSPLRVRVASLGVRGFLGIERHSATETNQEHETLLAPESQELRDLAARGLSFLREAGVRRVHHLCNAVTESLQPTLSELGFATSPGETLLVCDLSTRQRVDLPLPPPAYELRGASAHDVETLRSLIASVPELAILDWEWDLVRRGLHTPSRQALVVEHENTLVGALIGGHSEQQGTVSHLWVAPEHRHSGLGRCMTAHALTRFITADVKEAHVMTTAGNELANAFWRSMGFVPRPESFLEIDL